MLQKIYLFSSPPYPNPYICPTPGTALQHKIESKLEKSLGTQFNIQLQQQMGVFQASMLEAMKSLREEMQSMKKAVDQTLLQLQKPDLVNSLLNCQTQTTNRTLGLLITWMVNNLWKWTFVVPLFHHGTPSEHSSDPSDHHSEHSEQS